MGNDTAPTNIIRVWRVLRGWSQRELAQAACLSPWRLWRIEAGISVPRPDEVHRLLAVLSSQHPLRGTDR